MITPQLRLKALGLYFVLLTAMGSTLASAQATYIYFNNETGLPDDAVYVNLTSAITTAGLTGGDSTALSAGGSYSLAQLIGSLPGSSTLTNVPLFSATQYNGGGRIFITLGQPYTGTATPANTVVSGLVEPFIDNSSTANNIDLSYVDSISLPMSLSVNYTSTTTASGSTVVANTPITFGSVNPIETVSGTSIFTALTTSTSVTPTDARAYANTLVTGVTGTGAIVPNLGTITGLASVSSASTPGITGYHTWATNSTDLLPTLGAANTTVAIASYTVPNNAPKEPGLVVGFDGSNGTSPFGSNDPSNEFLQAQTYNLTANFSQTVSGGNIGAGNVNLPQGAGVVMSGSGSVVGNINIYILNSNLDSPSGIYGGNPTYTIAWNPSGAVGAAGTQYVTTQNTNSLTDRIVGDLSSVIDFGMAGSTTAINTNAPGTQSNLAGTIFAGNTNTIGSLTSGEYLYLLILQENAMQIAEWTGSSIQTNADYYDTYGSAFAALTNAYTYAYSDRLAGESSPDLFYNPGSGPGYNVGIDNLYIEVDLLPGDYVYAVPEPGVVWLMPVLLAGMGLLRLRSRRLV